MATTTHNHKPNFGRKVAGCPRCVELAEGAPARTSPGFEQMQRRVRFAEEDRRWTTEHLASAAHREGRCGVVCTYGES